MSNSATDCAVTNCNCGVCNQCRGVELSSLAQVDAISLGQEIVLKSGRTILMSDLVTFLGFEVNQAEAAPTFTLIDSDTTLTTLLGSFDVDASGGTVTINLPAYSTGKKFLFRRINASGGNVVINAPASTINGSSSQTVTVQYATLTITSATTEWAII